MESIGKGCGREVEGIWKVKERDVEGKGKGCGREVEGLGKVEGRGWN